MGSGSFCTTRSPRARMYVSLVSGCVPPGLSTRSPDRLSGEGASIQLYKIVKALLALPYLPRRHIPEAFEEIAQRATECAVMQQFLTYVDQTWMTEVISVGRRQLGRIQTGCSYEQRYRGLASEDQHQSRQRKSAAICPVAPAAQGGQAGDAAVSTCRRKPADQQEQRKPRQVKEATRDVGQVRGEGDVNIRFLESVRRSCTILNQMAYVYNV